MKLNADQQAVWAQIAKNEQAVALAAGLIKADEHFTLTDDQRRAIDTIEAKLDDGIFELLLRAPTGSGKTEVMFRVAVGEVLRGNGYACIIGPTRDLVRQDAAYFRNRLEHTGLGVAEIHSGISPAERRDIFDKVASGEIRFIIGSAMLLSSQPLWAMIDRSVLTVVDDVNAFDEREHLRLLEDLDCPLLFASATPDELRAFLQRIGAFQNVVPMREMPFAVIPTKIHKIFGVWGEPSAEQLTRAESYIRDHLERNSRIFVIGRTRDDIPRLAGRLEQTYGIPVQQLRGDMADSAEQSKRYARKGVRVHGKETRVEMMRAFLESTPSMLAATNLVGSGLDIPAADLIVITDADAFGEGEVEQLIGRVGRRERPSDAVLITGTTAERNPSRGGSGGPRKTFMPRGMRSNQLRFRR